MKITIDTKEDSPEEIRKLIRMLFALIGDSAGDYGSQRTPPASGEGLFDMFGDPAASTSEQQQMGTGSGSGSQGSVDINAFIDKNDSDEKKSSDGDDDIKVVPY